MKDPDEMIVVVVEEACSDTKKWAGTTGFTVGDHLYHSCTNHWQQWNCVREVAKEIKKLAADEGDFEEFGC